ncbi:MAG TPA: 2-amino-4-hydroxy-6-hydroxymethyldihydropteridine diphosphokinase [Arenimonas sp.]|nr:2-amino-4-hydroxy-6-hydroxymethyldihydropteridine diphosphokinase [Arenimonas sp.]
MTTPAPLRAYIGLGGNEGDVVSALTAALQALDALPQSSLLARSRFYRTPAWGQVAQPDFINAVAELQTTLPPRALLDALLDIERGLGRTRSSGNRWGPRTVDLDLLLYGDSTIDVPGLVVPHPHLHQRAFVLKPLLEVAPALSIPGHGSAAALLAGIDASGIEALA